MNKKILNHYKQFSLFTYPGLYIGELKKLPNDIKQIGNLVRSSFIHRTTLATGNTGTNSDKKYGDMDKVNWWNQPQDDYLVTAGAMLTELYRLDSKGFHRNKNVNQKLILTCRFVSIMIASILKSKGIACRVRSGFASYFESHAGDNFSWDHWINQYYDEIKKKWIRIDVDGSWHDLEFDPYDIPNGKFDFAAQSWLDARDGKVDPDHFHNAGGFKGFYPLAWELIYDFHCLMNREIIYLHGSDRVNVLNYDKKPIDNKFLEKLDNLAKLMLEPDENFDELVGIWESDRELRLLKGALL